MAPEKSADLIARLSTYYKDIDLTLRDDYFSLLRAVGNPDKHLPPIIHVAGTNGKGSTVAFLRGLLEAAGLKVHAYTSPHLVRFHERIRLAGELISENYLVQLLEECLSQMGARKLTQFEVTTVVAFMAFARTPADVLLLETGMGGRLDSTNIIEAPIATTITRISHDHAAFLGDTLPLIASEKAGIFKRGRPAIVGPQPDAAVRQVFIDKAAAQDCPLYLHGRDWDYTADANHFTLSFKDKKYELPQPSLLGAHQYANAATAAVTLLAQTKFKIDNFNGLAKAEWPARLQRLTHGPVVKALPGWEIWLDGGHNDSAGEVLAAQMQKWQSDGKSLSLIYGMINTKTPQEFLAPLAKYVDAAAAIAIPGEDKTLSAEKLAEAGKSAGIKNMQAETSLLEAAAGLHKNAAKPGRLLITGSLYLAGYVLQTHK